MKKAEKLTKIEYLTRIELRNKLSNFRKEISNSGVAFGNVVYFVDESGSRLVKGKKVLQKFVRTNVTIGADYTARVNRDLTRQGEEANFEAQHMSGKKYINDERVLATDIKTETKTYLVAVVEHQTKPDTVYFHEGKHITKDKAIELNLFMPSYFEPKKTSGRGNMSEEKDFHVINPNLDNIRSLTLNKVKYVVID